MLWCSSLLLIAIACCTATAAEPAPPPFDLNGVWVETPFGKPVIDRGEMKEWDHYAVDNPFVFVERGVCYCFYEGQDNAFQVEWHEQIGLAVPTDGLRWEKVAAKPLIPAGQPGEWDDRAAKLPAGVVQSDGKYHRVYSGRIARSMALPQALPDG